jgi:3',5'-cyclic AMP phosphodiesterase CpdA
VAVSWLHISDFHIKTGDPYDRDVVLKALVQSVEWHRTHGHPVDLIFATGDIAYSGQAAEYEIATRFFDDLLKAAHLNKDRLFLIPGNHDVDRDVGESLLRTLASEESAVKYFLPGRPKLHLTEKQAAFLAWHDAYFPGRIWPRDSTCGPIAAIEINNQPIAVLPINSALFCQDDFDHNQLWVGRRPLEAAIEQLPQNALKIALIHHPLDWLNDAERTNIKALLTDNFRRHPARPSPRNRSRAARLRRRGRLPIAQMAQPRHVRYLRQRPPRHLSHPLRRLSAPRLDRRSQPLSHRPRLSENFSPRPFPANLRPGHTRNRRTRPRSSHPLQHSSAFRLLHRPRRRPR